MNFSFFETGKFEFLSAGDHQKELTERGKEILTVILINLQKDL